MTDDDLERFVRAHHHRVLRALTAYTGDRDVALEATQEAFAIAMAHPGRLARARVPEAWVMRVAMNEARGRYRRAAAENRAMRRATPPADLPPSDPDPPAERALRRAVAALPERQRRAVVLRHVVGLSVDETAAAMRCRPGTVRALTHQGLTRLRRDPRAALANATDEPAEVGR